MKKAFWIFVILAVTTAVGFASSTARVHAKMTSSAQQMRAVIYTFRMYETDYGSFPVSENPDGGLYLLYRQYVDDCRVFHSPNEMIANLNERCSAITPHSSKTPQEFLDICSYIYVPGYQSIDDNAIVMYERISTLGFRNVGTANGDVSLVEEQEVQRRLKNNPKPLPKVFKKGDTP